MTVGSRSQVIRNLLLAAAASITFITAVHAQGPAEWQRIELGNAASRYPFAIYSNQPWDGDMSRAKSAVLVFHGLGRNGKAYYATAEKLLRSSGADEKETLLLAPNFFSPADRNKQPLDGMPLWQGNEGWNGGWDAANWREPLSAFRPIDDLLQSLVDRTRFPALERITLAGHSGGGQIVQRYAALNNLDETIRGAGITLRYVVANPSSYLYFTSDRPHGETFSAPDPASCPGYNDYKYGTNRMLRYARDANGEDLFRRYAARDVTYLLGAADDDPNHRDLDRTCGAQAQGANRLERGRRYIRYERHLAASGVKLNRQAYEVERVGHTQSRMLGSKCGARLIFGLPEDRNQAGAPCHTPER